MKNILFDLDGTLTDPKEGITKCIKFALQKINAGTPANLDWCIGPPLQDSFAQILNTNDPITISRCVALYRERFAERGMYENRVYGEITNLLQLLKERKLRLYIATSKPQVFAVKIAAHFQLDHFFAKIYGSELDGTNRSKTDLLRHILLTEKIDQEDALMIGDRLWKDRPGASSA